MVNAHATNDTCNFPVKHFITAKLIKPIAIPSAIENDMGIMITASKQVSVHYGRASLNSANH